MGLFKSIKDASFSWAADTVAGLLEKYANARFESAFTDWNSRSLIPGGIADARFEMDSSTRLELLRRARYWEENSFLLNRLSDLFEQYVAGAKGLRVVPDTSVSDFNDSAAEWWSKWCLFPDVNSRQNFGCLQSLMARRWFIDGEVFILKSYSKETGRPRLQLIEGHRVATPMDLIAEEGNAIIDGVKIDKGGRPIGYYVKINDTGWLQSLSNQSWGDADDYVLVPADNMIHLFEPLRPGQYRGITFFYAVLNDVHDLEDLSKLEMRAAKDAASVSNIITTATGEIKNAAMLRRQKFSIQSQNQTGQPTIKPDDQYYQTVLGGRTLMLKTGEKMEQFKTDRPSVATQWYYDFMVSKVCAGVGISRLLVLPYSMQGTVVRSDLDTSSTFFRSRSTVLANAVAQVYAWVMGWAVMYDPALDGAPRDFLKMVIRPPRSVNVDVGRNSAAMIAELQAGIRTFQDVYAELGEDWREQLTQKAEEAALIKKLSIEYGVERAVIAAPPKTSTPSAPEDDEEKEVPELEEAA